MAPLGPRQLQLRSQSVPVSYDFDPNLLVHPSKRTLRIKDPEHFPKNVSFHLSFPTKSWTCLDHPKTAGVPLRAPRGHPPRPPESSCSSKERLSSQKYQKRYQNLIFISDDTYRSMSATTSIAIFASILGKGRCPLKNQSNCHKTEFPKRGANAAASSPQTAPEHPEVPPNPAVA